MVLQQTEDAGGSLWTGVDQSIGTSPALQSVKPTRAVSAVVVTGPKRLHISNLPFRFREADLRNLLSVST